MIASSFSMVSFDGVAGSVGAEILVKLDDQSSRLAFGSLDRSTPGLNQPSKNFAKRDKLLPY
jgi:hypothetical protein